MFLVHLRELELQFSKVNVAYYVSIDNLYCWQVGGSNFANNIREVATGMTWKRKLYFFLDKSAGKWSSWCETG